MEEEAHVHVSVVDHNQVWWLTDLLSSDLPGSELSPSVGAMLQTEDRVYIVHDATAFSLLNTFTSILLRRLRRKLQPPAK